MDRNKHSGKPKIAICFFGIIRDLSLTAPSIRENIILPARDRGDVSVFTHLYRIKTIENPRSGETTTVAHQDASDLESDLIVWDSPDVPAARRSLRELKVFGDYWSDDFRSLRNLCYQHFSLLQVTNMALGNDPDIVIFARPDLIYHDTLGADIDRILQEEGDHIILPNWQHWGGLNDRFAIARGRDSIASYGTRGQASLEYCRTTGKPLHSERLVRYVLERDGIAHSQTRARASRARSNGSVEDENFEDARIFLVWRIFNRIMRNAGRPVEYYGTRTTRRMFPHLFS